MNIKSGVNVILILFLLFGLQSVPARACEEMDPEIQGLLKEKQYEQAEKLARKKSRNRRMISTRI